MKAKLLWKCAFNVCIWNTLELFHLCYYLKQQIVHLSAILNATLKDGSTFLQQNWRDGGNVANADLGLKIWPYREEKSGNNA